MGNAVGDQTKKDSEDIQKQKILESRNGYIHEEDRLDGEVSLNEAETANKDTDSKLHVCINRLLFICVQN